MKPNPPKRVLAVLSLAVAGLVVPCRAAPLAADEVHGIVLRINDRIATLYDFRQRYAERVDAITTSDLDAERRAELLGNAGRQTFCDLFQELLVLSKADQLNLEVDDRMVSEAVDRARQSFGFETDEEMVRALEQSGRSLQAFRDQTRRNLLIQQVMSTELAERMAIEEEDLRRYYQTHLESFRTPRRVRLRETVVLEASEAPEVERRRIAEAIQTAVAEGSELEEAVADYPDRGLTTGVIDLGWVESGDLEANLEAAVWELEAGDVSLPVEARGGLHVAVVDEVEEARIRDFSEVRDQIATIERERIFQEESGEFLRELVDSSYIVDSPPPEAAGYRAECGGGESDLDLVEPAEPATPSP